MLFTVPDPFLANEALAITVAGAEFGVYKYNVDTKIQADRLKKFKERGRAYIIGIPFPIEIQGSFMILGLEKNPKKRELIKAIKSFE